MNYDIEDLNSDEKFEKRIATTCSFNNAKCEFKQGRIINVRNTNISFIEPHRVSVTIKDQELILIYFDKNNLFFHNRSLPLTIKTFDNLLKEVKSID